MLSEQITNDTIFHCFRLLLLPAFLIWSAPISFVRGVAALFFPSNFSKIRTADFIVFKLDSFKFPFLKKKKKLCKWLSFRQKFKFLQNFFVCKWRAKFKFLSKNSPHMGRKTQRFYFFSLSSSGGCCVTGRTRGPSSGRGVVARNNSFGTDGNGRVGSRYYVAICHIIQRLLRNQHDDDSKSVDNLFLFNFRYKSHRRDLSRLNGSITSRDKRPMACFHTSHVVSDLSPTNFILTRIEMLLKIASTLNSRWHQTAAKRNAIPPLLSGGTMNECRKRKKPKRAGWKDCKFLLRLPLLFRW